MTDFRSILNTLRRPRLLIRAARHGVQDYRRDRDLRRLIGPAFFPSPDAAMPHLIRAEEEVELSRKAGSTAYSITRHIELLIALMAESRLLPPRAQA